MDPSQQPLGRSRGRGRALYQHPKPHNPEDHPGQQRRPWSLTEGGPRPPAPMPGRTMISAPPAGSSSEDTGTTTGMMGRGGRGVTVKLPSTSLEATSSSTGRGAIKMTGPSTGSDPTKKIVYPEARPTHAEVMKQKRGETTYIRTRPQHIESKVGADGQKITCEANFFRIKKSPAWNIYQYRVDFEPEILLEKTRRDLIRGINEMFGGGHLFDGTQLFLTIKLDDLIERTVTGEDGAVVRITIKYTAVVSMLEGRAIQILNLILRRAMDGLKLQTVGRNKYDAADAERVPSLRLEVWPGYITSIRQHEEDILVGVEMSHKIMRGETVYDIMNRARAEQRDDFKKTITKALLGTTVLTDYNNKTYRIDDILFDECPLNTFETKDGPISYVEYYKKYNKHIKDQKQPLLVSNAKARDIRGGQNEKIVLIPELCRATGLTDEMRSNFRTMKELAQFTKVGPKQRMDRLIQFNKRLRECKESSDILQRWNLELDPELIKIPARIIPIPKLVFGGDRTVDLGHRVDWTNEFRSNSMYRSIELTRWFLIVPARAINEAKMFLKALQQAAKGMYFKIEEPKIKEIGQDNQITVSNTLTDCADKNPQMIVCVVSNNQADRYATIKKRCFVDFGIPNQVLVHKTITPKDKSRGVSGLMSVATKVAIQMNCKLGGIPWMIEMPLSGLMTVGYDVCHDPKDKRASWGAVVATMDLKKRNGEFFSAVNRHENAEEMSKFLSANIAKAIETFYEINGSLPARILFFRDGVGEGQIEYVHTTELEAIRNKMKEVYYQHGIGDEVKFTFLVVTKRVNTRIFFDQKNPTPGTCVDDIITLPERYDFYLVPQSVNQGTVTPTGFNVIYDSIQLPPDRIQQLAFRFTFFYFNWSGTVRVPALCQYAHKLAFLASQSMQTSPNIKLNRTLYYL